MRAREDINRQYVKHQALIIHLGLQDTADALNKNLYVDRLRYLVRLTWFTADDKSFEWTELRLLSR